MLGVRALTYGFYRTNIQPVRARTELHLFLLNSDGSSASDVDHRVRTHTVLRARLLASLWKLVKPFMTMHVSINFPQREKNKLKNKQENFLNLLCR